jgi:hypothetical protein
MDKRNLTFRKMKEKDFMLFFEVDERQARRKKAEMLEKLGLPPRSPVYFPAFCQCVNQTEDNMRRFFGLD